jgi:hypothetical protein
MKIAIKHIKSELKDLKKTVALLCKGKGFLSDYLLISLVGLLGLISGYLIW